MPTLNLDGSIRKMRSVAARTATSSPEAWLHNDASPERESCILARGISCTSSGLRAYIMEPLVAAGTQSLAAIPHIASTYFRYLAQSTSKWPAVGAQYTCRIMLYRACIYSTLIAPIFSPKMQLATLQLAADFDCSCRLRSRSDTSSQAGKILFQHHHGSFR